MKLFNTVVYLDEAAVKRSLLQQNEAILKNLAKDGVSIDHVIYVQYDDAGSSSGSMLNLLRDAANLERSGCHFVDGHDVMGLHDLTNQLSQGAIIYVDDFIGTGKQFCDARDAISGSVIGTFSEFLLAAAICEEALGKLGARGVEWKTEHVHMRAERPLHEDSFKFPQPVRERLRQLALQQHRKLGLGYRETASMVVLYRNTPNTVPLLLRGDFGQSPKFGIFPRAQDFPPTAF